MNLIRSLLVLSLLGNAGLFVHWQRVANQPAVLEPSGIGSAARSLSAAPVDPTAHIDPDTWAALAPGGELTELVARLRAQGYPPAILRTIVQAQIRERFAERFEPLRAAAAAQPYWRVPAGGGLGPQINLTRRALDREMRDQLSQLVGDDWMLAEATPAELRRRYGNLPPEKIFAVARINSDYADLRAQISIESLGVLFPEDREKIAFLEKEKRADLARQLTADELLDYDLHTSGTAGELRYRLVAFEPTEQEFRAIYALHRSLDAQFGPVETLTPDRRRQRTEAEKTLAPQIEAALGVERYADFKRLTDPTWLDAHRALQRMGLAPTLVPQLAAIQQDLTKRGETLRADRTLNTEQRAAQLAVLEREAVNRLTPLLGDRFADYKANNGYWLRQLQSPKR